MAGKRVRSTGSQPGQGRQTDWDSSHLVASGWVATPPQEGTMGRAAAGPAPRAQQGAGPSEH